MSEATSTRESRRRLAIVKDRYFPAYVVWELTLRCDQPCAHCGSRAGKERPDELTTEKALTVADELADMGAREVVLIGGEAYLHPGFLDVTRRLRARGVTPVMTTGGRGITAELARAMKDAGLARVSVSVDGLAREHNLIRKAPGSFESAIAALGHLRDAGIQIAANTNGTQNFHRSPVRFQVQAAIGPMPRKCSRMIDTPMMTKNMMFTPGAGKSAASPTSTAAPTIR